MYKTKSITRVKELSHSAKVKGLEIICEMTFAYVKAAMEQMGILDKIQGGNYNPTELAIQYQLNLNALRRTIRFYEFYQKAHFSAVDYQLTQTDIYFLEDSFGSFAGAMNYVTSSYWQSSWDNYSYCLHTGKPAFNHIYKNSFFEYIRQAEGESSPFYVQMNLRTELVADLIAKYIDFTSFNRICDVGGGKGGVLKSILDNYPRPEAILFDVAAALQYHELQSYEHRVKIVQGDFFDSVPRADCMMLKTILHDWSNEKCIRILENCRQSLLPGGSIFLVEQLVEPPYSLMQMFYDLHMLVMYGGAERSLNDFIGLAQIAGLSIQNVTQTNTPLCIIELSAK